MIEYTIRTDSTNRITNNKIMLNTFHKYRGVIVEIISALFVLLFVYAALSKVQDFQKFRIELGKSPILNVFSDYAAIAVPTIEIVISLLLVTKRFQYAALYASFSLMVIFSLYILVILNLSSYIPCSCGGILENMSWKQHLIFNIAFVVLAIIAILLHPIKIKNLSAVRGKAFGPEIVGN